MLPEETEVFQKRDKATDELYDLRRKRYDLYWELIKYLPKQENGIHIRPETLLEMFDQAKIAQQEAVASAEAGPKRKTFGRKEKMTTPDQGLLDKLLDWGHLEQQAEKLAWNKEKIQSAKEKLLQGFGLLLDMTRKIEALEKSQDTVQHFAWRAEELKEAEKILSEYDQQRAEEEKVLDRLTNEPGIKDESRLLALRKKRQDIADIEAERQEFLKTSPEAYYIQKSRELREMKQVFDKNGKIVETPYVLEKINKIMSDLRQGTPVFIHGELGAGKTELAMHICRTRLSEPHLLRWEKFNPMPDPDQPYAVAIWAKERQAQMDPIVVHGHRGMESDELTWEREIQPGEAPVPAEQAKQIDAGWRAYSKRLIEEAKEQGEEIEPERLRKMEETYRTAQLNCYVRPIETRRALRGVLLAMQQGRPVIIDEINAIPHHVLIVLNDYLMRKPGETITPPFPDIPPFEIQNGFAVIATGNYKPEDGQFYAGRQQVDAAFLSRFGVVHYDYLPGQRENIPLGAKDDPEKLRQWRQENELLNMMLARLLDNRMRLSLPPGALRQMEKLAMVARNIQDVFSQYEVGSAWMGKDASGATVQGQTVLKENVLSLRHLLRVLDRWHADGYAMPLDVYLYEYYVERSTARPLEMMFLYDKLSTQGDFFKGDEWPAMGDVNPSNIQFKIKIEDVKRKYAEKARTARGTGKRSKDEFETLSERQVIEQMFGPAPVRTMMPEMAEDDAPVDTEEPQSDEREIEMEESLGLLGSLAQRADTINVKHGEDFHV